MEIENIELCGHIWVISSWVSQGNVGYKASEMICVKCLIKKDI